MDADEETRVSEITILPDGRVCVFGASEGLLHVLFRLNPADESLRQRVKHAQGMNVQPDEVDTAANIPANSQRKAKTLFDRERKA